MGESPVLDERLTHSLPRTVLTSLADIGGYIPGGQNFSELLIGEYRDDKLTFIKRLIAGFTPHTRAEVFEAIKGLRTPKCPFANLPESRKSPYALTR